MGTQHAQRVVSKGILAQRIIHRESVYQISGLYKHAQQQFNKWHAHVTMFVCVCTIITRQGYCMPHMCT